jgi:hypothetical protein
MVRLLDLELAVGRQLRELPHPAYLCSMCAIGGQLREAYADLLREEARALAAQTVEELRAACLSADSVVAGALALSQRWQELLDDPTTSGPVGLFSAMVTFHLLTLELAGEARPRAAVNYVDGAASQLPDPGISLPPGPHLVRDDPAEIADETSPGVQLLRKFGEVATLAGRRHDAGLRCDPESLRSAVFG